eukprot:5044567-Prymnesium_polylepis.1
MVLLSEEHLATGTETVNRRMATHLSDVICSPGPGEQYLLTKRLAIRRFTASVPVARCCTAGPSPRSSTA